MKTETSFQTPNASLCAVIGLATGVIFYILLYAGCYATLHWPVLRLLGMPGDITPTVASGDFSFTMYVALYAFFFWGVTTIFYKRQLLRQERAALIILDKKFPSSRIIGKRTEIDALKATISHGPDGARLRNTALVRTLLFLMDHCLVTETSTRVVEIFTRRLDMLQKHVESSYNILQYIAWGIPSVGFIGTVWGIGAAIANAGMAMEDIRLVTQPLGVAFDTTLIALLESLILMFLLYHMQHQEENLINSIDLFCQEKFIINLRLEEK